MEMAQNIWTRFRDFSARQGWSARRRGVQISPFLTLDTNGLFSYHNGQMKKIRKLNNPVVLELIISESALNSVSGYLLTSGPNPLRHC